MKPLFVFVRKLYQYAGRKLYVNLLGMVLVGFFEGIGIYLLVPLLGVVGILNTADSLAIPLVGDLDLSGIPEHLALPAILIFYVLLIASAGIMQRSVTVLNTRTQQGFVRSLRVETYHSLLHAKWEFFLTRQKSDFQHILTSELARVSQGTMIFLQLTASVIFTLIQIAFALLLSPLLTVIVLLCGLTIGVAAKKFVVHAKTLGDETTHLSQDYYAGITDQLNGMKEIKSNMLESVYVEWFQKLNKNMERNNVNFVKLRSNTQLLYRMASALLIALFVYIAFSWMQVNAGHLLLLVLIFARVWPRFMSIQSNIEQIVSMFPAFQQLITLQKESHEATEFQSAGGRAEACAPLRVVEYIECRDVYFRYSHRDAQYALRNINMRIPAHAMTAIVGRSGSGKSTLVDTVMGLIEPEQGHILVDGRAVDRHLLPSFRASISYVSQEPFLFHTSIRDNLLLGNRAAAEEEIWAALTMSAAAEFVHRLPQGLDTVVGDRGVRLSGGERQRIVLARAIMRKPEILVLDEATSALDVENEVKIQQALENLKGRMTLIVIAHRLSTIRNADHVVVLEHGEIVQQGGFMQLTSETKGVFNQLWRQQSKGVM